MRLFQLPEYAPARAGRSPERRKPENAERRRERDDQRRAENERQREVNIEKRIAENEKRHPRLYAYLRSAEFQQWYECRAGKPWERRLEADPLEAVALISALREAELFVLAGDLLCKK